MIRVLFHNAARGKNGIESIRRSPLEVVGRHRAPTGSSGDALLT